MSNGTHVAGVQDVDRLADMLVPVDVLGRRRQHMSDL
jgi:hypothetical protein